MSLEEGGGGGGEGALRLVLYYHRGTSRHQNSFSVNFWPYPKQSTCVYILDSLTLHLKKLLTK